jgi:hypothetical protein
MAGAGDTGLRVKLSCGVEVPVLAAFAGAYGDDRVAEEMLGEALVLMRGDGERAQDEREYDMYQAAQRQHPRRDYAVPALYHKSSVSRRFSQEERRRSTLRIATFAAFETALVDMSLVHGVAVAVVLVVDVIAMLDGGMPAVVAVLMGMIVVNGVLGHKSS